MRGASIRLQDQRLKKCSTESFRIEKQRILHARPRTVSRLMRKAFCREVLGHLQIPFEGRWCWTEDLAPKRRFRDRVKREVSAHRISVLLVEFGTFSKASYADANLFFEDLRQFLRNLQAGSNRAYASAFPSEGAYLTALATGFIPMYTCSWEARNGNFSLLQSRRTVIFVTPGAVCRNGYR